MKYINLIRVVIKCVHAGVHGFKKQLWLLRKAREKSTFLHFLYNIHNYQTPPISRSTISHQEWHAKSVFWGTYGLPIFRDIMWCQRDIPMHIMTDIGCFIWGTNRMPILGYTWVASFEWQTEWLSWGTNGLPLLRGKQNAYLGGQMVCPWWGSNRTPILGLPNLWGTNGLTMLRDIWVSRPSHFEGQKGCLSWEDIWVVYIEGHMGYPFWEIYWWPSLEDK